MATQIIELLTDDLTGGEATETIRFAYDGVEYTIDLNTKNAARLRKLLATYIDHGTRIPAATRTRRRPAVEDTKEGRTRIREWARDTGTDPHIGDRGRIPRLVVDAYHAAHR